MITESVTTTEYSSDIFKSMDADNSNFVTAEEVANYLKKNTYGMLGDSMYQQMSEDIVKSADIDGNSKMSLGEYALSASESKEIVRTDFEKTYGSEEAKKIFDQYDTDKNGKVSQDEIKEVDKANNKSNGLSTGAIVGIVIGAVCLVGLIVGLIVYLSRKNKKEAQKDENNKNKEKSNGNNIDYKKKTISRSTQNNLDSVNKQKDKDQSAVR